MIGCFIGIIILSLAKSNVIGGGGDQDEEEAKYEDKQTFYFGLGMISCTALMFSSVGVLTRKMKSIHFSIIQFDYGVLSCSSLLLWILIEYGVYMSSDDPSSYGYESLRIINYGGEQWALLLVIAIMNAIGMNAFTLAF